MRKTFLALGLVALCCIPLIASDNGQNRVTIVGATEIELNRLHTSTYLGMFFLEECEYFKENYPKAWAQLNSREVDVRVIYIPIDAAVCGMYFGPNTIIVSKPGFENHDGCYGDLVLVLAHELLHHLDLPDHKDTYVNEFDYLEHDPIEKVINRCSVETLKRERG